MQSLTGAGFIVKYKLHDISRDLSGVDHRPSGTPLFHSPWQRHLGRSKYYDNHCR
jgi:hypothetical protein